MVIFHGHRLLHLRLGIAQRVLAERRRDGAEILARRAVFMHVAARAEGVLRHRAEMAEFRPELARALRGRHEIVLLARRRVAMRARPAVAPVAAHDRRREPGVDRHHGEDDRENLARPSIVERGGETHVDSQPRRDHLVMRIDVVGTAHHEAIDVFRLQARVVERVFDRLFQQGERVKPHLP